MFVRCAARQTVVQLLYNMYIYEYKDPPGFELLPVPRETRRIGLSACVRISVRNASVMDTLKRVVLLICVCVCG